MDGHKFHKETAPASISEAAYTARSFEIIEHPTDAAFVAAETLGELRGPHDYQASVVRLKRQESAEGITVKCRTAHGTSIAVIRNMHALPVCVGPEPFDAYC